MKLHPQKPASRFLFSFHKEGHALQDRGLHPGFSISVAGEGDSGLYWCEAVPEGGRVQKQSPQLEIRCGVSGGGKGGLSIRQWVPLGVWGGVLKGKGAKSLGAPADF